MGELIVFLLVSNSILNAQLHYFTLAIQNKKVPQLRDFLVYIILWDY